MVAALQTDFAAALLDADRAIPAALTAHTASLPVKRFAVYRNNVVTGLINALRTRFPATERIVGKDFFVVMAHVFVTAHPPRSKILSEYGENFADFIAAFTPAADLPYLADVARLEAARTRAYHATDAQPLSASDLAALDAARLNHARVLLHPSLQIVCSRYPVATIWGMNAGEIALGPVDRLPSEDALVLRPAYDVFVHPLPAGGAAFLRALARDATLIAAAEAAVAESAAFDLTANLAGLIRTGALIDVILADEVLP